MIDSHCHLAGEEFESDLPAVVDRARSAGVASALVILAADDEAESKRAKRVGEAWPSVRFSIGIHPHQAGECAGDVDEAVGRVESAAEAHGAVAIGEIGLDYHYDFAPRPVQQDVFRRQIDLARRLGRPVVVHTREASEDTFAILREAGGGALRGVFHCFTGDAPTAASALEIGFYLSFAGIVTFPKAAELRDVARLVPADRLLIETDAPYLAPVPHRGKRNEPAFVARVLETLAAVREVDRDELVAQTTANFQALFGRQG
jgi:TatD DNase family protein